MVKGYIVLHQTLVFRLLHLQLFRNTGTDKRQLVRDAELFSAVDRTAHQGTLHRKQLRDQLGNIALDIANHRRTRL